MKNTDKGSIVRTVVLVVALGNQALVMSGKSPIPYSNEEVESGVTTLFTIGASLLTWWKNNYVGVKGNKQKVELERKGLK